MKPEIYKKAKLLEGIDRKDWIDIKRIVDEAFDQKERELKDSIKLSADTLSKISETGLF
ncbi:MAG: hypothetical protein Q4A05_01875 [Ruminococcus sp.]|nr:hypothetical protein [Ruminococcus sp.]